jgi:hypothetical protein
MLNKVVRACALVAALSILAEPGVAKDAPPLHQGPIYNGFNHQPTEDKLRALHQHDVTPDQAHEIDRLYDQLLSSSERSSQVDRSRKDMHRMRAQAAPSVARGLSRAFSER